MGRGFSLCWSISTNFSSLCLGFWLVCSACYVVIRTVKGIFGARPEHLILEVLLLPNHRFWDQAYLSKCSSATSCLRDSSSSLFASMLDNSCLDSARAQILTSSLYSATSSACTCYWLSKISSDARSFSDKKETYLLPLFLLRNRLS